MQQDFKVGWGGGLEGIRQFTINQIPAYKIQKKNSFNNLYCILGT